MSLYAIKYQAQEVIDSCYSKKDSAKILAQLKKLRKSIEKERKKYV
tara:strand:- start:291 stop:428 length:138 start_codon:yes stop_codon:yes gene_type:complete